ncbi:Trypsin [Popillia japonica]|uniref:Trypsin n=1 Tax=Popillia japonica TaxID=7064 RepID=A0AAW1JJE8_POPJA
MVCCIKTSYFTRHKRATRKSEEACTKFGPGIPKKETLLNDVQPGDYQHNVGFSYGISPDDENVEWGLCTGTLISENYVLTVAHCVTHYRNPPLMIRAGTIDMFGEEDRVKPQDVAISDIIVHPDYDKRQYKNDLALVKLAKPVRFTSYVQPACLYTGKDIPDKMVVTGWGRILQTDHKFSDLLLKTHLVLKDSKSCNDTYKNKGIVVQATDFCGLATNTKICHTGSGSASFITDEGDDRVRIVGLTSRALQCAYIVPNVFVRVSNYLDWIESIVWP